MGLRRPIVAGRFYEAEATGLKGQIEGCFLSPRGPGRLPKGKSPRLLIVPHAGYMFSGPCAASAYAMVGKGPDVILLIGPSHGGQGTCLSDDVWETPLGKVQPHPDMASISRRWGIPVRSAAHHSEHSLEVQLPFLQFALKDMPPIVPLMVGYGQTGLDIDVSGLGDVLVVVSSDFTHWGPSYGYMPFKDGREVGDFDRRAIDPILRGDNNAFLDHVRRTEATICGAYAIVAGLGLVQGPGKLLSYYTSGDILDDYANVVGYASISFPE